MTLTSGTKLGPYEILSAIGAGGMGEVYKARDTRLNRTVAIKVLPSHFSDNAEMKSRFDREAQTIAGLNHPHICVLHDVGHQDGTDYLVMEYLEGQTLAQRLEKGALPLDEALKVAIEIADALDKAHRQGVVHRDLKPSNVMLTKSGAKLLDFGLAKLKQDAQPAATISALPTNADVTAKGTILGTLQYMSPEQLEGQEADARSDIFAFGAVVYEIVAGQKAFQGRSPSSVIAAIMHVDPPGISAVKPMTPPALDRVVRVCLSKDPDERWQSAGDLRRELKWIAAGDSRPGIPVPVTRSRKVRERLLGALALIGFIVALFLTVLLWNRPSEDARVLKMSVLPPEKAAFSSRSAPAISPDGRRLAFVATLDGKNLLWVRDLDSLTARPLRGTDGAEGPFWSPDSRFIAFFAGNKLKKVDANGGPATSLCDIAGGAYGGSWGKNDVILFAPINGAGISRVSAAGGAAETVTTPDHAFGEISHRLPSVLPDGHHFLFTARNSDVGKEYAIYVADLDLKPDLRPRHLVLATATNAIYVSPGYLLFMRDGILMAQPFNADKVQATGDAFPVAEQIDIGPGISGLFASSQNGVLAYLSGSAAGEKLMWFDRSGKPLGTLGPPSSTNPAISQNGTTVAAQILDSQRGQSDIWLYELLRGTASRFTFGPQASNFPVWSPDGKYIAFRSTRDGPGGLHQKSTTGTAREEVLDESSANKHPDDWSRDGRYIIEEVAGTKGSDIWILPLFGDRKPLPYLETAFNESYAKLSPDGHWLAYVSDESKRNEVYVQTFPMPGTKWQISKNGGSYPVWSRDGKELFFIGADQAMMSVEVKGGAQFEASEPNTLFETRLGSNPQFDVSKDGRFLIPTLPEQASSAPISIVINWTAALNKK
jgi:serine/threonine protein kinase/Tol biopolymer transport system component